jgi:Flp pilus assembly pilin Flp
MMSGRRLQRQIVSSPLVRDQNAESRAFTVVHALMQPIQGTEANLHPASGPATLTVVRAWCYHLDVTKVVVRRHQFERATSLVRSISASLLALRNNQSGAIQLEYTILLGLVGLSSAAALVLLGVALVDSFGFVRGMLLTPFP